MRYGFTTGSCAAAAAKAAAYMLLTGQKKTQISITTPKGIIYSPNIREINQSELEVSCAVEKDGGDDPDVTTGLLIYASVRIETDAPPLEIRVDGGEGVGRVTRPGLDQPVGHPAINHIPREMIVRELQEVCALADFSGTLAVTISAPGGEAVADRTFNPRLGIIGGISILGTSGIVEPMSSRAIVETIRLELKQRRLEGASRVAVAQGNYGQEFMKKAYGYDLSRSVKCSNYIGETIDLAAELGYTDLLLTGHIGKLVKVAGGLMNTHSREGDCRMELLAAAAVLSGGELAAVRGILECPTTEEALHILENSGIRDQTMDVLIHKIEYYLNRRGNGMKLECVMYSNEFGELAKTQRAIELLEEIKREDGSPGTEGV